MAIARLLPASAISRSVPAKSAAVGKDTVLAEGEGLPLLGARQSRPGLATQAFACPMMVVACGENEVLGSSQRVYGGKIKIRLLPVSITPMPWLLGSMKMPCGLYIRVRSICATGGAVPLAVCVSTPIIRAADI